MKIRPIIKQDRQAVLAIIHSTGMFTQEEEQVAAEVIDVGLAQSGHEFGIADWIR